jgi:hypothetical protein
MSGIHATVRPGTPILTMEHGNSGMGMGTFGMSVWMKTGTWWFDIPALPLRPMLSYVCPRPVVKLFSTAGSVSTTDSASSINPPTADAQKNISKKIIHCTHTQSEQAGTRVGVTRNPTRGAAHRLPIGGPSHDDSL